MFNKWSLIKGFYSHHKGILFTSLLFAFLSATAAVMIPLFLGKYYQIAFHSHSGRGKLFDSVFGNVADIQTYFIFFFLVLAGKFIFNFLETYFGGVAGSSFSRYIRELLFKSQIRSKLSEFEKKSTGTYLLRYSGDLSAIHGYITKGVIGFIADVIFIAGAITFFFVLNAPLTTVILIVFPLIFLIHFSMNQRLKIYIKNKRNIKSSNLAFVSERLRAIKTIKLFNREPIEISKFNSKSSKLFSADKKYLRSYALINSLYSFLLYCMLGILLYVAYTHVQDEQSGMDGGEMLTYILLTLSTIPVYKRILKVNTIWQTGNISFKKLSRILNTESELRIEDGTILPASNEIVIRNLSFGFDELIFENLSLEIRPGCITRISGIQGSGKTTLLKLIAGLYQYKTGSIKLGNLELNTLSRQLIRKKIALASEELPLIGKTIFEAVSYSRKEEKKAAVSEILNKLGFEIKGVKSVLTYPIHEGGANLSAGERKLLIIARALLTKKKILLLDEPFRGLDPTSSQKLADLLETISPTTAIAIINEKNDFLSADIDVNLNSVNTPISAS